METMSPRHQILYLKDLLAKSRAAVSRETKLRGELGQQLLKTHQEMEEQRRSKEMLVLREKEAQKELEKFKKNHQAETPGASTVSTREMQLEEENQGLKMLQRNLEAELQQQKDKNQLLHEELEKFKASQAEQENLNAEPQQQKNLVPHEGLQKLRDFYKEMLQLQEADLLRTSQWDQQLQQELQMEIRSHEEGEPDEGQLLVDVLQSKMEVKEVLRREQEAVEQLEKVKAQLLTQLSEKREQKMELLTEKIQTLSHGHQETRVKSKKTSVWKRLRLFVCVKKKKKKST